MNSVTFTSAVVAITFGKGSALSSPNLAQTMSSGSTIRLWSPSTNPMSPKRTMRKNLIGGRIDVDFPVECANSSVHSRNQRYGATTKCQPSSAVAVLGEVPADWPSPLGASANVSLPVLVATVSWAELSEVAPTTAATRAITKIRRNWLCFIACGC
jgi:hypothetical protein